MRSTNVYQPSQHFPSQPPSSSIHGAQSRPCTHRGAEKKKNKPGFSCQKDKNLACKHIGIHVMLTPGREGFVTARCWDLKFCFCMSRSSHIPAVPTCGGLPGPHSCCAGTPGSPLSCTGGAGQAARAAHPGGVGPTII